MGRVLAAAGFDGASARLEILLAGGLDAVPDPGPPPLEGLVVRRGWERIAAGSEGTSIAPR